MCQYMQLCIFSHIWAICAQVYWLYCLFIDFIACIDPCWWHYREKNVNHAAVLLELVVCLFQFKSAFCKDLECERPASQSASSLYCVIAERLNWIKFRENHRDCCIKRMKGPSPLGSIPSPPPLSGHTPEFDHWALCCTWFIPGDLLWKLKTFKC